MYGYFHESLRQFMLRKFGEKMWMEVVSKAGFDHDTECLTDHCYPDSDTYSLVDSIAELAKMTCEEVWETFGRFFVEYALDEGWEEPIRSISPNLKAFFDNLDFFHFFIAYAAYMKDLQTPSFRSEESSDGSITLYYLSGHVGLYPFVMGGLTVIAQRIFNLDINLSITNKTQELVGVADHKRTGEYVTFRIKIIGHEADASYALSTADSSALANFSNELKMSAADFCIALPYHIVMDEHCCLVQVGNALKDHVSQELLAIGTPVTRIFEITWPQIPFDFKSICSSMNAVFVLQAIESLEEKMRMKMKKKEITHDFVMKFRKNFSYHLQLRGQMMLLSDGDKLIYICSPDITSLYDLAQTSMKIAEIPVHDSTRNLVLLREFLIDKDMHRQLEANNEHIESLENELKAQEHKLGMALRKVMPETLAVNLMKGERIEAREYAEATVMFTDIPRFQEILSVSHPKDVVHLLEELFHRFDRLIGIHNVYKVDTVGDNFMTVAGIPDEFPEHAEMMCYVAIGMLWESRSMLEPISKKPLKIRIAIHSGPLVAGVIASETPRFCVFGETIQLESALLTCGIPGKVICSEKTYYCAMQTGRFEFTAQGRLRFKSKVSLDTYVLLRSAKKSVWEIVGRERNIHKNTIEGYEELETGTEFAIQHSIVHPLPTEPSAACSIS